MHSAAADSHWEQLGKPSHDDLRCGRDMPHPKPQTKVSPLKPQALNYKTPEKSLQSSCPGTEEPHLIELCVSSQVHLAMMGGFSATYKYRTIMYFHVHLDTYVYLHKTQYTTIRCDAMRCDAMQCNAMQYNIIQYVCVWVCVLIYIYIYIYIYNMRTSAHLHIS